MFTIITTFNINSQYLSLNTTSI